MNTNESVVKTTRRVKECTAKIQNREQVRFRHFEPLIRDVRTVEGEKQEAVVAGVAASKRNDEFLAIFCLSPGNSIALAIIQTTRLGSWDAIKNGLFPVFCQGLSWTWLLIRWRLDRTTKTAYSFFYFALSLMFQTCTVVSLGCFLSGELLWREFFVRKLIFWKVFRWRPTSPAERLEPW